MNKWKFAIILAICCCIIPTAARPASADFVGVTTVYRDDPDTEFLCTQGNGEFVPGPLTVCNVYAEFDNPDNLLLAVANADLQVFDGESPGIFFHHPVAGTSPFAPICILVDVEPDLICDSFVTFGVKCDALGPPDTTHTDGKFVDDEFNNNGHIVGGWFVALVFAGQGVAGNYPDLQLLILQSSVAQGSSLSGHIDLFWAESLRGVIEVIAELDVPIECAAVCPEGEECDDGDFCTEDDQCIGELCVGSPIDCNDENVCTDDSCDPASGCISTPNDNVCDDGDPCTTNDQCGKDGCVHGTPVQCPKGQSCDPATGECVADHDPCECVDGRVTICHMPPGNPTKARTISVGCRALAGHLAHGDSCGPCQ